MTWEWVLAIQGAGGRKSSPEQSGGGNLNRLRFWREIRRRSSAAAGRRSEPSPRSGKPAVSERPREILVEFEKNVASCEPVSIAMRSRTMPDSSQAFPGLSSIARESRPHPPFASTNANPGRTGFASQIWCSFVTGVSGKISDRQAFLFLLPWTWARLWTGLVTNQPILRIIPTRGVYGKPSPTL